VWEERDRERESERERERSLHQYCCTQHSQPHNNTTAHQWNSRTIQQCNGAPLQEGIGIGRLTANFAKAVVSFAMLVSDQVTRAARRFESPSLRAAMVCSVLYCVAACCAVLQRAVLCCNVLCCVAACCAVLQRAVLCCNVLYCVAACRTVLQRAVLCCSVLCCVAACRTVLQRVVLCCSVRPCVPRSK
jgi:hypothetical protein